MRFVNQITSLDNVYTVRSGSAFANLSIVNYPHKSEFVYRAQPYLVRKKNLDRSHECIDRSRKFTINVDGVVVNNKPFLLSDFLKSRHNSHKRSLDMSYRYALSNNWRYFATFTFSAEKVDRFNDSAVIYCWKLIRQRLQSRFPEIKIFCVPERHQSGALHFHALIGNADLSDYLIVAINPHTDQPILSKFGDNIYNLSDKISDFGFTTVAVLQDSTEDRVANYLTKYITKSSSIAFNLKSYYHTYNCKCASKISALTSLEELLDLFIRNMDLGGSDLVVSVRKQSPDFVVIDVIGDTSFIYLQKNT